MFSGNDDVSASYHTTMGAVASKLIDKSATERLIRFVADNHNSPSLKRGMDYFERNGFRL
jgi:hypothetical protein